MSKKPFAVAITGGIASGKSVVAERFHELFAIDVIDTDQLAKQLLTKGHSANATVVEHFGEAILAANGEIDRAALKQLIFADSDARAWLEALLHPQIRQLCREQVAASNSPYVLVLIPLLAETSPFDLIDRVLVVDTPVALQRERVSARDGLAPATIDAILKRQATREQRLAIADDVLVNDKSLSDLAPQIEQLHRHYLQLSQ